MRLLILFAALGVAAAQEPPRRIDWRRVEEQDRKGKTKDTHTAKELTELYLAAVAREEFDDARAIARLIGRKPDADVLAAAVRMIETGSEIPTTAASILAHGVLLKEPRMVTPKECAALEEAAARILEREVIAPEGGVMPTDERKQRASEILAALGTPRATEILVKLVLLRSPYAHAMRRMRYSDVGQLALGLLDPRADHFAATPLAEALAGSADGRAELRKLLDPKSPFAWREHGAAKGAAFVALTNKFQELDDLVAIEAALVQVPDLVDPTSTMLPYSRKTPEQAEAVVAFLAEHKGARIEDALLLAVALLPPELRGELLPRLEAAYPGSRERVEAKRRAWDAQRER